MEKELHHNTKAILILSNSGSKTFSNLPYSPMPKMVESINGINSAGSEQGRKLEPFIIVDENRGSWLSANTQLHSGNRLDRGLYADSYIDSGSNTEENYRQKPRLVIESNKVLWVRGVKNSSWLLIYTTYPRPHWEPLTFMRLEH